jgi:transcriptional regulator GlxA family with amidase domain
MMSVTALAEPRRITVILFDGFELLDVFGPLEFFALSDRFVLELVGPTSTVLSAQGPGIVTNTRYEQAEPPDIVLVPGGIGTRALVADAPFLQWFSTWANDAALLASVCTGSAVLASAGLLTGYRATSNKRSFDWVETQGKGVEWIYEARWVVDRNRWTSSGVAAGMDMALALIGHLCGASLGHEVANAAEYTPHEDPDWDPFASTPR